MWLVCVIHVCGSSSILLKIDAIISIERREWVVCFVCPCVSLYEGCGQLMLYSMNEVNRFVRFVVQTGLRDCSFCCLCALRKSPT